MEDTGYAVEINSSQLPEGSVHSYLRSIPTSHENIPKGKEQVQPQENHELWRNYKGGMSTHMAGDAEQRKTSFIRQRKLKPQRAEFQKPVCPAEPAKRQTQRSASLRSQHGDRRQEVCLTPPARRASPLLQPFPHGSLNVRSLLGLNPADGSGTSGMAGKAE